MKEIPINPYNVDWMRDELTDMGIKELKTIEEVNDVMESKPKGTMLLVINSVCGCAAGNARPGLKLALENTPHRPQHLYTVFAGQDKEATQQVRSYFSQFPPSSPSFAYFIDGEIKAVMPRNHIETHTKEEIGNDLIHLFESFAESK